MKLTKYEFWLREVIFLGHMISSGGIVVDLSKVETILQWETLKYVTKIRSFLGLADYNRRFIEGFLKLAFPWNLLTRKGQAYLRDVQCEDKFQELINNLIAASVLIFLGPSEVFVVYCDALKRGLGGVLMFNGHVVTYASRQLKVRERNYLIHELELVVVVFVLKA